jgi:hypothetical protein
MVVVAILSLGIKAYLKDDAELGQGELIWIMVMPSEVFSKEKPVAYRKSIVCDATVSDMSFLLFCLQPNT